MRRPRAGHQCALLGAEVVVALGDSEGNSVEVFSFRTKKVKKTHSEES